MPEDEKAAIPGSFLQLRQPGSQRGAPRLSRVLGLQDELLGNQGTLEPGLRGTLEPGVRGCRLRGCRAAGLQGCGAPGLRSYGAAGS